MRPFASDKSARITSKRSGIVNVVLTLVSTGGIMDCSQQNQIHLDAGSEAWFSRECGQKFNSGWPLGHVSASEKSWCLTNESYDLTIAVENLEDGAELLKVPPRQNNTVIPFELSRLTVPSQAGMLEILAYGPPPSRLPKNGAGVQRVHTSSAAGLSPMSKYFAVLVALCEPKLRGSTMSAVPSVQDVVDRLKNIPGFEELNRSAVNYHVDYLLSSKLRLEQWARVSGAGRLHAKREALVTFALRYDLVRQEHLILLTAEGRELETAADLGCDRAS